MCHLVIEAKFNCIYFPQFVICHFPFGDVFAMPIFIFTESNLLIFSFMASEFWESFCHAKIMKKFSHVSY